jgi:hypothetical protein
MVSDGTDRVTAADEGNAPEEHPPSPALRAIPCGEPQAGEEEMTKYSNKKYGFTVEAYRIEPDKPYDDFVSVPEFGKLFADLPEAYWLVKYENTKMLINDELFHRFFVREPALA